MHHENGIEAPRRARRGFGRMALVGSIVLALTALAVTATAGPGKRGHGGGLARAIDGLELDAETRTSIDDILAAARSDREGRREVVREARQEMRALLASDASDEAILAQADTLAALKAEVHDARLATLLEVRALLTPDQRQVLAEQRRERRGRKGDCGDRDREDEA